MGGAVTGMALQQLPHRHEQELQDRSVPLRQLERALDRRLGGGGIAEPVAAASSSSAHGRAAQVEHLRGAVDPGSGTSAIIGASASSTSCGRPSASASAAAAMRIPAPSRSPASRAASLRTAAVSPSRTCVQDPAAHFHREHVLAGERGPHRLRGAELRQGVLEPALPEPHEART